MNNVDQVRRYYACVDAGKVDELVGLFAPDAVYERPGYPEMKGHSALTEFYESQRIIESGEHTLQQITADGTDVAVHGRFAGLLKDARRVELRFADFFTFADGLIARRTTFFYTRMV
ncbi:nuclear transport factor 2 family protein [Streptomyces sp. NPDC048106]|uniref:nuclear transport factor 2 family protein n=1 Tax=Streptomyces sp. NPDC048106 TaxID=3155750 RepID=UPI003454ADDA